MASVVKGFKLLEYQDYLRAQIEFSFAISSDIDGLEKAQALHGLGISKYFQKDFIGASRDLARAINMVEDRRSYVLLIQSYIILNKLDQAREYFNKYEAFCARYKKILVKDEIGRHAYQLGYGRNLVSFIMQNRDLESLNDFQILLLNAACRSDKATYVVASSQELIKRNLECLIDPYTQDLTTGMYCKWEDIASAKYEQLMLRQGAIIYQNVDDFYAHVFDSAQEEGLIMQFGVYKGEMLRKIAHSFEPSIVYGFDCFNGLPEDWGEVLSKGHFALERIPEFREDNICLCVGLFEDTLPEFKTNMGDVSIRFAHIDCDLYSSTQSIFKYLGRQVSKGTVLLFDEYYNYAGWMEHEYLAFKEFVLHHGISYEYIAICDAMVAVLIK